VRKEKGIGIIQVKVISGKEYPRQSFRNFRLLPCACELKQDICFQKSPYANPSEPGSPCISRHSGKNRNPALSYRFAIELMLIRRSAEMKQSGFLHTRNCGKTEGIGKPIDLLQKWKLLT